jgi:N-acyl-D-amino-acid deacylase
MRRAPWLLGSAALAGLVLALAAPDGRPQGKARPAVTGKAVRGWESIDRLMTNFLDDHKLPGAALAVARDGRLLYARGFGHTDPEKKELMQPDSLFRIATLSTPITATAVLKLAEQGKFKLGDRIFDLLKIDPHLEEGERVDPRLKEVTVLQCLQHTAGWKPQNSFDPMFAHEGICRSLRIAPPASRKDIVRYVWGRGLDYDPGQAQVFSQFGYCALGCLVEKMSGQTYERYVSEKVLKPIGITRMRLGKTLEKQRAPGEVKYRFLGKEATGVSVSNPTGKKVPLPYGTFALEPMDSSAGWLGSAVDLARFGQALARSPKSKLLRRTSLEAMQARPAGKAGQDNAGAPKQVYWGCAWLVSPTPQGQLMWHVGLLPGSSTLLVIRPAGLCWAVLFNCSVDWVLKQPAVVLDAKLHGALNEISAWPRHNLFSMYR